MSNESITDFIDGQRDCREGLPANPERNEAYQQGYGYEFQLIEISTHKTLAREAESHGNLQG